MNDWLAPESHNAKVDSCFFPTRMITGITGRIPLLFNEQNAEFAFAFSCGSSTPCSSRWCRLFQPLTPHALYVQSFTTCFPAKQQSRVSTLSLSHIALDNSPSETPRISTTVVKHLSIDNLRQYSCGYCCR